MTLDHLVSDMERKPCACGRRKTSEPQIPVGMDAGLYFLLMYGSYTVERSGDVTRYFCTLQCGVCGDMHKACMMRGSSMAMLTGEEDEHREQHD